MEIWLLRASILASVVIAFLLPLFLLAVFTAANRRAAAITLVLVLCLFLMDMVLNLSPRLLSLPGAWGDWNWQGKLLEIAWPLAFAAWVPGFSFARIGLSRVAPGGWRWGFILCLSYALFLAGFLFFTGAGFHAPHDLPTVLYQMLMPGLAEEFVFRGVLQSLLNEAFGRPWKFAGIQFGWGYVIVASIFGVGHGIGVDHQAHLQVVPLAMIFPLVIGFVLGWLRERAASVWPGVLLHAVIDGLAALTGDV